MAQGLPTGTSTSLQAHPARSATVPRHQVADARQRPSRSNPNPSGSPRRGVLRNSANSRSSASSSCRRAATTFRRSSPPRSTRRAARVRVTTVTTSAPASPSSTSRFGQGTDAKGRGRPAASGTSWSSRPPCASGQRPSRPRRGRRCRGRPPRPTASPRSGPAGSSPAGSRRRTSRRRPPDDPAARSGAGAAATRRQMTVAARQYRAPRAQGVPGGGRGFARTAPSSRRRDLKPRRDGDGAGTGRDDPGQNREAGKPRARHVPRRRPMLPRAHPRRGTRASRLRRPDAHRRDKIVEGDVVIVGRRPGAAASRRSGGSRVRN